MNFWKRLWTDESGQVGGTEDGTRDADGATDDEGQVDAGEGGDQQNSGEEEGQESFVDPGSLSDELKDSAEFKGMQRAFSKKMNTFRGNEQKIQMLDRMSNDPEYLKQFVTAAAQKVGLQVSNGATASQQSQSDNSLANVVQSALPAEYTEAMPGLSQAIATAIEAATAPIKEQTKQANLDSEKRVQQQNWDRAAQELTESDPEWEDDSDEIGDLWNFLKGGEMFHPVWGNKLTMLRKLARGDSFATTEAANRMRSAVLNKTQTGRNSGQVSMLDIHNQIKQQDRAQNKWETAGNYAREQLRKSGGSG